MLKVPIQEDGEGSNLTHRLICDRNIPVYELEDFSRHLLRPHNNEKISIRPVDFLNNVRQSQSIGGQVDNFSALVSPVSNRFSPWFSRFDRKISAKSSGYFSDSSFNSLVFPIRYYDPVGPERTCCETDVGCNP